MKKITTGIVAHVDAGKTTLSENFLYLSGCIRKMGRVDNQDAFFDTDRLERARGITIFSKQAGFTWKDTQFTLLDTPGHIDFSAEMERTLQVLDYAILVISGADGVQGHTMTLFRLLERYQIPVFLFVNKMDQPGTDRNTRLMELKERLDSNCIWFNQEENPDFLEEVAMGDEEVLDQFLSTGEIPKEQIQDMIAARKIFPVFFGSALKAEGVEELLDAMDCYMKEREYPKEFGAKVYKIARDEQGNRLTFCKITGGVLKVKAHLSGKENGAKKEGWEEKVNQIRIYSGEKYETVDEVLAGEVCALTGLTHTYPGEGIGDEEETGLPVLEPVLTYRVLLPEEVDAAVMLPKLRVLEEEDPTLHVIWDENLQEIQIQLMGEVQIEVLKSVIAERFDVDISFDAGSIVYKETIKNTVEGVGHFEPLRHYAEVHLLLEPGEPGSGISIATNCSEDLLDKNWQRLISTHLEEKEFKGVLTGSALTDVKITVVGGRAHQKHTEGGDFRQATYRAVRQGLMQAESVLLEPFYRFRLEVPMDCVGRAMTDIEKRNGVFKTPDTNGEQSVLTGRIPVSTMRDYQKELLAYTKGRGKLFCELDGYGPCHNMEEVVENCRYDVERDLANTADSVFCAHGAGFIVPWYEVPDYMHVESFFSKETRESAFEKSVEAAKREAEKRAGERERFVGTEEIDAILAKTFDANRRKQDAPRNGYQKRKETTMFPVTRSYQKPSQKAEEYLLVDGYNVIFAWQELKELAEKNMDSARGKLLDLLCNYQGIKKCNLIVVFDAYRVVGHETEVSDYHNIHVVFTKEAETADQYIEKFAHENGKKYNVTVATSDGLEQIIIRGEGCHLISSRELEKEMKAATEHLMASYQENKSVSKTYLTDYLSDEAKNAMDSSIKINQEE